MNRKTRHHTYSSSHGGIFPCLVVIILLALFGVGIYAVVASYTHAPTVTITAVSIGTLGAALAWTVRRLFNSMEKRTRLIILEELSHGEPLSRQQIRDLVRGASWLLRFSRSTYADVLSDLLSEGLIVVNKGSFSIPNDRKLIAG